MLLLLTALGAVDVTASSAKAPLGPRPGPRIFGVVPATPGGASATHRPRPSDFASTPFASGGNLLYHGGPVMQTNTTYTIYWLPAGQTMSANYQGIINGFFRNVATGSGLNSTVYGSDTQYYMGSNPQLFVQNSSSYGGSYVDTTSPIPGGNCNGQYAASIASHLTGCVSDAQIENEIEHVLGVTGWTPGPNKLFLLFTPRSVGSCVDTFSGTCAYTYYCAYHSDYVDANGDVLYTNQPYPETTQLGMAPVCDTGQHPNGDWADATLNVASHEQNEAITDPDGNAWFDSVGNENGDKCAWTFGTALGSTGSGQYNTVIGTGKYYLQQEWSNASSSCVLGYGPSGTPANTSPPSMSGAAVAGQTLSVSAGSWSGSPPPSFAYQWMSCDSAGVNCSAIGGAIGTSYVPSAADVGSTLVAQVTAANTAGSGAADTAQSAVVAAAATPPQNVSAPSVSGSTVSGQLLTASPGTWSGSPPPSLTYQWQRCDSGGANCASIVGATAQTYALTAADVGSTLRVAVTASNIAGSAGPVQSAATAVVASSGGVGPSTPVLDDFNRANGPAGANWSLFRPSAVAAMNVSGSAAVDASTSLFAWDFWNASSFGPDCEAYVTVAKYGAADTIRIGARTVNAGTAGASGYFVSVSSTGAWSILRIDSGASTTLAGGVTQALAPGDRIGIRIVGSVITALHYTSGGGWVQVLSYDTGSDPTRYTAAGRFALEFRTSTLDDFGGGTIGGASVAPQNVSAPSVSGSAVSGQLLSASPGTWTGSPTPTLTYQWQRCDTTGANCLPIAGATTQTYTLTATDVGSTIRIAVTATNTAGTAGPIQSAPTAVVTAASVPPQNVSAPSVSGSAVSGQLLSASPGTWTGSPTPTLTYQWQRCDTTGANCLPIAGATTQTYTLTATDVGSTIRIAVTATNTAGTAGPIQSAPTAVVTASGGVGPSTPVLDDFNRANGPAGANWSLLRPSGVAAVNVSGNAAVDASASAFAWDFWNASSFGPDCEAYVTVAVYGAADTIRIGARVVNAGTATASGYFVSVSSTGVWSILRIDGGPSTTLAGGVTQALASGDKIAIRVVGNVVTALHYTSGGGWVQVLSYDTSSDATRYTAAGQIALEFKTSTLDDLGGGSI